MTVKLNSLARWSVLDGAEAIAFEGTGAAERRVRIDFNLEGVTTFFIGDEDGENFLCTIGPGLETVEFNVAGAFKVYAEKGSGVVHYLASGQEATSMEVPDPVIFTRIAQRRTRNPELEEMMHRMQLNIERRMAMQADELSAIYERRIQEVQNVRTAEVVDAGTPPASGGNEVSAQGANGEEPGEAPAPAAGSQSAGGGGGGSA